MGTFFFYLIFEILIIEAVINVLIIKNLNLVFIDTFLYKILYYNIK